MASSIDDGQASASTARRLVAPALLTVIVIVTYVRTVGYGLYFDDNVLIRSWSPSEVWSTFSGPFNLVDDLYFRPFASTSFATEWQIWGSNAWGYHLTNLALHLAVVLLLYAVLRRCGAHTVAAALGAGYFALLPSNAATVLWISERTDAVAAITILSAVLVLRRYEVSGRVRAVIAINGLLVLGLLFKEQTTSLIPVVLVFMVYFGVSRADAMVPARAGVLGHWRREGEVLLRAITDRTRLKARLVLLGSLCMTFAVYFAYRVVVMPAGSLSGQLGSGSSPPIALIEGAWNTLKGVPWETQTPRIAVVLLLVSAITLVCSPRSTWWRLYIAGVGVIAAGVIPLAWNGGVEPRLLYVASTGVAMMVAALASVWAEWLAARVVAPWRLAAAVGVGALLLALTIVPTLVRAQDQFEPTSAKQLDLALQIYTTPETRARVDPEILAELEQRLQDAGLIATGTSDVPGSPEGATDGEDSNR